MGSFVVTGPNAPAQILQNNEYGVIGRGASLEVSSIDPVTMTGDSALLVAGLIASGGARAISSFADSDIVVDQGGSILSGAASAISYSGAGARTITNSGTIAGSYGLHTLSYFTTSGGSVPIISHDIANSGVIQGYLSAGISLTAQKAPTNIKNSGTISGADDGIVIVFSFSAPSSALILNTGIIDGGTSGIDVKAGLGDNTVVLRNSGTIIGHDFSYDGSLETEEVVNTGEMIGDISLLDGNDLVDSSSGRILGDVMGGVGADTLLGGASADSFFGGSDDDRLHGGDGHDMLAGDSGADTIDGGAGDDMLTGGDGTDLLDGGAGNDFLEGGAEADSLSGGRDDDMLLGGTGADTLHGGSGDDSLSGGDDADLISGGPGADTMHGDVGSDTIRGDAGDDLLFGGPDGDSLEGGAGDDTLFGGEGASKDRLWGGSGADVFVYETMEQFGLAPATNDFIYDFEPGIDRIDLSGIGGLSFSGTAPAAGGVASVWQTTLTAFPATILRIDIDGDGSSDAAMLLIDGPTIAYQDLILV